jgi:phosphohistidine phosphatase
MKSIFLLRHAKASKNPKYHSDFIRPLSARGLQQLTDLSKLLLEKAIQFDYAITSPAFRALNTGVILYQNLNWDLNHLLVEPGLYYSDSAYLLKLLHNLPDEYNHVLLIGHNPQLNDLAAALLPSDPFELRTANMIQIEMDTTSWKKMKLQSGKTIDIL